MRHSILIILCLTSLCNYAAEKIMINGLFRDKAIVTIDGKRRVLNKGEPSPEGILLIEASSKEAIIKIDGEHKKYTLGSRISNSFAKPSGDKKLVLIPDASGMYTISGQINGSSVHFVIDTGATLVSMNSNIAKRLGIDYKLEGKKSIAHTASGKDRIYLVNLKRVRIGNIELHNIKGAVHEGNFPTITLLGMSFLSKLNMKREGRIMELQKKY